ncbi:energy transducer TonB [Chitinimonas sp. BJB300]|uniref:energy transducer TonB n=1 Tax=Chitinimonas sp. BJB300 TaxID=1559339 RepID=UPI0013042D63|nr:energy transducer TonB [Chitinimonas sp. BJB300]
MPPRGVIPLLMVCGVHAVALGALALSEGRVELPRLAQEAISVIVLSPQPMPVLVPISESLPVPPKPTPLIARRMHSPLPPQQAVLPAADAVDSPTAEAPLPKPVAPEVVKVVSSSPIAVVPPRSDASHLNNPAPAYPTLSRKLGEQGRVLVSIYVLADGSVGEIQLKESSGFRRLDEVALLTVKQWRFVPAKQGDTAIGYWYVQPMNFTLDGV